MIFDNFRNDLSKFDFNDMKPFIDQMNSTNGTTHTDIKRIKEGKLGGAFFVAYASCDTLGKDATRIHLQQFDLIKNLIRKHSVNMEFVKSANGNVTCS